MAISLEDLNPRFREQAVKKYMELSQKAPAPEAPKSKYHAVKAERAVPDGNRIKFDSQKEARRYDELMLLLGAGKIRNLKLQRQYTLQEAYTTPEGVRVRAIRYVADFDYEEKLQFGNKEEWRQVVEDVKSQATKTRVYAMKRKLMLERYQIKIREV